MRAVGSAVLVFCGAVLLFQSGCAGIGAVTAANSSVGTSQLMNLAPNAVAAGHAGFLLTAKGANFSIHSAIMWNGIEQATSVVSSDELTAQIPAQSVSQASTVPVIVKDMQSGQMSNPLALTIGDPPKITTTTLPPGQAGVSYSAPLTVSGGVAPFHWSTASGNMPAGLAMDSQTCTISGTAADAGESTVNVAVTDTLNSSTRASLAINIAPAAQSSEPTVTTSSQYYGSGIARGHRSANTRNRVNAVFAVEKSRTAKLKIGAYCTDR
jgi:hypothetical protein